MKVNLVFAGPFFMTLAAICSGDMTCLLDSCMGNFTLSSFYHIWSGFRVPEVRRIDRGFSLRMSLKVRKGTKQRSPMRKELGPLSEFVLLT